MVNNSLLLTKLSQNLLEILNDEDYYDITIEVGNDPYVKVFRAHMVILNYRSPYLRRILSTNKKNDGTLVRIKLPNILPETFQVILRYIYGGTISLEEYDTLDMVKILKSANELSLQELVNHLQSFLIENKTNWLEQNFSFVYQTSFEHDSFLKLRKFCTDVVTNYPDKIFKSADFILISEKSLVSLIRNDNLKMSSVQVWEYVIKWGLAQNPELSSDPASFSKEDFKALKRTLQQCVPLIRFNNLSSKEFMDKVLPYEKILPEELYKDLLKIFLSLSDPDKRPSDKEINIDSKIITFQHAELISKWIDRLEIKDDIKNSYKFKLLFRKSRDGATKEKFHESCDGKFNTATIVKVKGSNEILGGYNPIEWKSVESWGITKDSFIFSFKNGNEINDYILSRVKDEQTAVFNSNICGPIFGDGDILIWGSDGNCYCFKGSYEKQIRETEDHFDIDECEVFQIVQD